MLTLFLVMVVVEDKLGKLMAFYNQVLGKSGAKRGWFTILSKRLGGHG